MFDRGNLERHHASIAEEWCTKYSEIVSKISNSLIIENFLDIGANTGAVIEIFKNKNQLKKIFAFEPIKENFLFLSEKTSNYFESNIDVFLYNEAVFYGHKTAVALSCQDGNPGGMFLHHVKESGITNSVGFESDIKISCVTLEEKISSQTMIDLCKIDVEGSEWNILENSIFVRNNIKNILLEYHWLDLEESVSFIKEKLPMFRIEETKDNMIWISQSIR